MLSERSLPSTKYTFIVQYCIVMTNDDMFKHGAIPGRCKRKTRCMRLIHNMIWTNVFIIFMWNSHKSCFTMSSVPCMFKMT